MLVLKSYSLRKNSMRCIVFLNLLDQHKRLAFTHCVVKICNTSFCVTESQNITPVIVLHVIRVRNKATVTPWVPISIFCITRHGIKIFFETLTTNGTLRENQTESELTLPDC
ncbi:hypothetical protein C1646_420835 [Rhizophagus diaphanus]|nr:hypothetical protein C1646_420835 [Rhizophagus diaphanus] [Rhizophagus sp. MUCL 43196]